MVLEFGVSDGIEGAFSFAVNEKVMSCSRLFQGGAAKVILTLRHTPFGLTTETFSTPCQWADLSSHLISKRDSEKPLAIE